MVLRGEGAGSLTNAQAALKAIVVNGVPPPHSRRVYVKFLDDPFAFAAGRLFTVRSW